MTTTIRKTGVNRNSTLELLRIICMLLVIAHHAVVHGGSLGMDSCVNKYIASLILPVGKIAFTCFVAISTWFLVDQQFKAGRFIRTWLEVLFYGFLMMFPSAALGAQLTPADWIGSLLPIGGNSHGFAATYLVFYLLLPAFNRMSRDLTKKQTLWIVGVLFYAQVGERMLAQFGLANLSLHPFMSEITLFALCFFLSLYLKRWTPPIVNKTLAMGIVSIIVWALVSLMTIQSWRLGGVWQSLSPLLAADESGLLYLIGGFSLFMFALSLPSFHSRAINLIASTTFGILLIHDHGFFRYVLWGGGCSIVCLVVFGYVRVEYRAVDMRYLRRVLPSRPHASVLLGTPHLKSGGDYETCKCSTKRLAA